MATTPVAESPTESGAGKHVSFYFSPHQDDWQLFMNPSAFRDVAGGKTKVVFIHMTAGDAGLGTGTAGRRHPLYRARENGSLAALSFMVDADDRTPVEASICTQAFCGRPIHRWSYRDTVAYFLRLPDGNPAGTGYPQTGYQSMRRLAEGKVDLTAIDDTASYRCWNDVAETLRAIIDFERAHAAVHLHIPEFDSILNPGDHSDHYMTARAALDATHDLPVASRVHHLGYASADRPENLKSEDRDRKCAAYAVTLAGVLAFGHPVSWSHYDQLFIARNYFRTEGSGQVLPVGDVLSSAR